MRRLALLAVAAIYLAATSPSAFSAEPRHPNAWGPARIGQPIGLVVVFIQPIPGVPIELLGAEPVGLADGASARFYLSRPVRGTGGDISLGEALEEIGGAVISAGVDEPDRADTVGIVARITAQQKGRYVLSSVRVWYRVTGGRPILRQRADVVLGICADDPAPTECDFLVGEP